MEQENQKIATEHRQYCSYEDNYYKEMKWRYEMLVKARNFHYENFNKWMTYFYIMIGALFVGVSYIISKSAKTYLIDYQHELIAIGLIGFTVSLFWYWANKGYYYWNINFITLVNHYEKNILKFKEEERIYFVFANKSNGNYLAPLQGANISTSKISIVLSFLITCFWGGFVSYLLLRNCVSCDILLFIICISFPVMIILLLSGTFAEKYLYSRHYHFPDLNIKAEDTNSYKPQDNLNT